MRSRTTVRNGIGALASVLLLFLFTFPLMAQSTGQVSGRIINGATGEPLGGAQVVIQGTSIGTMANPQGRYLILNVPVGTHTVEVTRLGYGYQSLEITVGAGETAVADFELRTEAIALDEVVVTGTAGSARRREIGNTIGVINADDIQATPITSATDVLQGRTAGLTVRPISGTPGAGSEIMLRGVNTLGGPGGNRPLIYVDGVRLENGLHQNPDEANTRTTIFDDLDPASIERIEVIKGAAATTLYGTEAAGGVIQVFTKGGGGGAPQWTATINQGISHIGHIGPKADSTGLNMNDCSADAGCPASGSWLKNGHIQEYELSVQGGTNVPWYVSGSLSSQDGNLDPQNALNTSLRANFRFEPLDNLNIRMSNMFTRRDILFVPQGNNAEGLMLNVMRGPKDYTPNDVGDAAVLEMDLRQQIDHFITGLNITWTPTASLSQRLNVGMDYSTSEYTEERPWGFYSKPVGNRENDLALDRNITVDYAGTYDTTLPFLNLASTTSWGAQYYDEFSWGLNAFGETFSGPGDKLITSAVDLDVFGEGWLRVASGGFFLQEQFGWNDRFFLTLGARWDGFSTFGEGFGLAFYPKVSGAYTISDHNFWPSWWETMKLRFAVGESGRAPGPFASKRTWGSTSGDTRQAAVILSELGNEEIGPERTLEIEGGFEASMLEGRFSIDFTYFDQSTTDALLRLDRPASIGTEEAILTNLGEVVNSGLEFSANASVYTSSAFSWDVGGNYYHGENKIVSLGPVTDERLQDRPVDAIFRDRITNPDEMGAKPTFENDYFGPARPTTTWGINTRMTFFRRLTLEGLGEFQGGHVREAGGVRQNVRREQWVPCQGVMDAVNAGDYSMYTANDLATCSHKHANYGNWTDFADFFRLRSVSLSYRVPENWLPGNLTGMTLRAQGRNLWHTTDWPGIDPEGNAYGAGAGWSWSAREYYNLPIPQVFMLSATVNF